MRFSQKGQSVIEYVIVFVLVGMGIAIMGPYAIRSIHGHMKAWEDAVDDSITDPLPDVDTSNLPPPQCACSPNLPHGCGLGGCDQLSMLYQRDCHPLGCEGTQIGCAENPSCCTSPVPARECGGCESDGSCCTPWGAAGSGSCRGDEGCPVGMVASIRQCGGGVGQQTSCQPSDTCVFECQGNQPDHTTLCQGDETGLRRDEIKIPVGRGQCTEPRKCEYECDPCFHLNAAGDACDPDPCCDNGSCDSLPVGNENCSCADCVDESGCLLPPVQGCYALPREDRQPFANCHAGDTELFRYCEGDCSQPPNDPDSRVTMCCSTVDNVSCRALPAVWNGPFQNCDPDEVTVLQYCSGDCSTTPGHNGSFDDKVTICCRGANANKLSGCRAIPKEVGFDYGNCNPYEWEIVRYCSGNCDGDDAKVTYCCRCGGATCLNPIPLDVTCPSEVAYINPSTGENIFWPETPAYQDATINPTLGSNEECVCGGENRVCCLGSCTDTPDCPASTLWRHCNHDGTWDSAPVFCDSACSGGDGGGE